MQKKNIYRMEWLLIGSHFLLSTNLLEGVINARKDYEKDSIVYIFHVIKNEKMEMSDNWIAVDIVYRGTTRYS